jgi:ornithine cyclodeaminase/alanine dehydrogenase-like protein (mu-crystallin family)
MPTTSSFDDDTPPRGGYNRRVPLWLTESDVRAALKPAQLIDEMESALAAFSADEVVQPVRTAFEIGDRSFFAVMPALHPYRRLLGTKLVTVVPGNASRGLHTHLAAITLFDCDTGELLAMVDGRYITEIRTAAVSAVSFRHLGRHDAAVLAILGSGVQARSHLEALTSVREFREIRSWSPTAERLARFVRESGGRISAAASAQAAVRGADVVVLATSSVTPAIDGAWVWPGTHVIAIGACRPSQQEMDPALVARAHLVVDSRAAALRESGDILLPIGEGRFTPDHIRAELGEIVSGRAAGRTDDSQVTVFKSLGLAIEDVTAAGLAFLRAKEQGTGMKVSF